MPARHELLQFNDLQNNSERINKIIESYTDSYKNEIKNYKNKYNEDMKGNKENGMIMEVVDKTSDMQEKNEAMQAAIDNDQIKKLQVLAQRYKDAHTTKVREYKKIGRNDKCPCGSGKKYKNCCMNSGKYENLISKK